MNIKILNVSVYAADTCISTANCVESSLESVQIQQLCIVPAVSLFRDNVRWIRISEFGYYHYKELTQNGVILVCFPPHTTHDLQPLDCVFYGPLKRYYEEACESFILHNTGKRITDYDIAAIFNTAYV